MPVTTNLFPFPLSFVFPDTPDLSDLDAFSDADDTCNCDDRRCRCTDTRIVMPAEPLLQEPEWMLVDPWVLEMVREYDARAHVG